MNKHVLDNNNKHKNKKQMHVVGLQYNKLYVMVSVKTNKLCLNNLSEIHVEIVKSTCDTHTFYSSVLTLSVAIII